MVSACVLMLVMMTPATRAECDCDKPEEEQKERQGFDKLLHKTICGITGAAKKAKETVKDGYHYVQNKLSSSSSDSKQPEETTLYDVDVRFGNTEEPIKLA